MCLCYKLLAVVSYLALYTVLTHVDAWDVGMWGPSYSPTERPLGVIRVAEVRALARRFDPAGNERASRSRDATLALLADSPAPLSRDSFDPGHVTASAIVLSPDRIRILLVRHRKLGRWLQPGGHLEPSDVTILGAAEREVLEETGVPVRHDPTPTIIGIDVHTIPATDVEPAHRHFDLVFRFLAGSAGAPREAGAVWCPVTELDRYEPDEPLRFAVERAVGAFG